MEDETLSYYDKRLNYRALWAELRETSLSSAVWLSGGWGFTLRLISLSLYPLLISLGIAASPAASAAANPFPQPAEFGPDIAFWERIYVRVSTDSGLLHDSRHLGVVYERLEFNGVKSRPKRRKQTTKRRRHWQSALQRLASGTKPRNAAERVLVESLTQALGRTPVSKDYRDAKRRIRFQLGQSDMFKAGLIRAGQYEASMRETLRQHRVPEDLAFLPHVESSFQAHAYSKAGAAGMWQFVPSTGRRFLTIDYVIDERLSPESSTVAAARLLRENYDNLGTWPLAITAYNHGAAGMRRGVKKLGTKNIATICRQYKGRSFGFASRNFYAQFLAARRVANDYEAYVGKLNRDRPESVDKLHLPFYVDATELNRHLGLGAKTLAALNPALRKSVWRADKWIPQGYQLRLPPGTLGGDAAGWLASLPALVLHEEQRRSQTHTVARGETLGRIAKLHGTSVASIVAINSLRNPNRIYPGQKLELNLKAKQTKTVQALVEKEELEVTPEKTVTEEIAVEETATEKTVTEKTVTEETVTEETVTVQVTKTEEPIAEPPVWRELEGDTVKVYSGETLGHYADWLALPTNRLRVLNQLKRHRPLRMGQSLKLDFSKVSSDQLIERRVAYHQARHRDFFEQHRVTGTRNHTLKAGESLWLLSHKIYSVPPWLIQRYNPGTDMTHLQPGTQFKIPVIEPAG